MNCKELKMKQCFPCWKNTNDGENNLICWIKEYHDDILYNVKYSKILDIKKYLVYQIKTFSGGFWNELDYLQKTIEVYFPQYNDIFEKIMLLL
jgi:hypothetical protein